MFDDCGECDGDGTTCRRRTDLAEQNANRETVQMIMGAVLFALPVCARDHNIIVSLYSVFWGAYSSRRQGLSYREQQ